MSRTDKTAPYNVKALYYPSWVTESHDHVNGVCELPEKPTTDNIEKYDCLYLYQGEWVKEYPFDRRNWKTSPKLATCWTCHYVRSHAFWYSGMARCGCPRCNADPYYMVPRSKRERMAAERYVRGGWKKEY
jgi:hypothetical protein